MSISSLSLASSFAACSYHFTACLWHLSRLRETPHRDIVLSSHLHQQNNNRRNSCNPCADSLCCLMATNGWDYLHVFKPRSWQQRQQQRFACGLRPLKSPASCDTHWGRSALIVVPLPCCLYWCTYLLLPGLALASCMHMPWDAVSLHAIHTGIASLYLGEHITVIYKLPLECTQRSQMAAEPVWLSVS